MFVYKANYSLRTALRVLIPIHSFTAKNENELYAKVRGFDWSEYLTERQTFAIDNTIGKNSSVKHSKFAALKTKDAIVDQFRDKSGKRPSVDTDNPDVLLNIHGFKDEFTISLDSSGNPLNQRGYRKPGGHRATLNEVLGAGLVMLSGWDQNSTLLDPMCGSGTIPIEAAMMAKGIPPQILRNEFGFMSWKNFNAILWNRVKSEARSTKRRNRAKVFASDLYGDNVKLVKQSAKKLGLTIGFEIDTADFIKIITPSNKGTIVSNPPYGERIGGSQIDEFYKKIGDKLKQDFEDWDAWMISSNFKALRALRLKPTEKHILFNGSLECQYCKYEMYAGSRDEDN